MTGFSGKRLVDEPNTENPDPVDSKTLEEVSTARALVKEVLRFNRIKEEGLRVVGRNAPPFDDDSVPWYKPGDSTVEIPPRLYAQFEKLKAKIQKQRLDDKSKEDKGKQAAKRSGAQSKEAGKPRKRAKIS